MKTNIKYIVSFVMGILVFGGVSYALSGINTANITYTKSNNEEVTLNTALDELYLMASNSNNGPYQVYSNQVKTPKTAGLFDVECGFKPDIIYAYLGGAWSIAYYNSEILNPNETYWYIPGESNRRVYPLNQDSLETGIKFITDTGFRFKVQSSNTLNINLDYMCLKNNS